MFVSAEWVRQNLVKVLCQPANSIDEQVVSHVLTFEDPDELTDFLSCFSPREDAFVAARTFAQELFELRKPQLPPQPQVDHDTWEAQPLTHYPEPESDLAPLQEEVATESEEEAELGEIVAPARRPPAPTSNKKKNTTPRLLCLCNGQEHNFISNCIQCGKIQCEREGTGSCLFCGNTNGAPAAYKTLPGYDRAVELTLRLVQYDNDAARRMQVHDMETDFYAESNNPWISEAQRNRARQLAAQEERNAEFGHREIGKLTIDLEHQTMHMSDVQKEFSAAIQSELTQFLASEAQDCSSAQKQSLKDIQNERMANDDNLSEEPNASWEHFSIEARAGLTGATADLYRGVIEAEKSKTGHSERLPISGQQLYAAKAVASKAVDSTLGEVRKNDLRLIRRRDLEEGVDDGIGIGGDELLVPEDDEPVDLAYEKKPIDTGYVTPEFTDDSDDGVCLTLHQPWASLMCYGFKRVEGRVWRTDYRGRLWIHSASREPEKDALDQMISHYSHVYGGEHPPLPPFWPTSVLLGCVDLVDCIEIQDLPMAIKEGKYTREGHCFVSRRESNDSGYVFVCKAPRVLVVPVQMSGQHKLWNLPRPRLKALRRSLRPVMWACLNDTTESKPMTETVHCEEADYGGLSIESFLEGHYDPSPPIRVTTPTTESSNVVMRGALHCSAFVPMSCVQALIARIRMENVCEHLCASERPEGYTAAWMQRYDRQHQLWSFKNNLGRELPTEPPPYIADLYSMAIKALAESPKIATLPPWKSVGGPHLPPLDAVQLTLVPKELCGQSSKDPMPQFGDPCILLVLAGWMRVVVENVAEGRNDNDASLDIIARGSEMKSVDLKQGDVLVLSRLVKVARMSRFTVERASCAACSTCSGWQVEGVLYVVMSANCWRR